MKSDGDTLSADSLARALGFIAAHGRPVERALAAFHFGDGTLADARQALGVYQNDDGGYGHGLEPDFLLPASSAMATSIALQYAADLGLEGADPRVGRALDYLAGSRDAVLGCWPATPATVNGHPHAPWWHHDPDKVNADALVLNPGAELVGHFFRWGRGVEATAWLDQTLACLAARTEVEGPGLEGHELLCCTRLADSPNLPTDARAAIMQAVMAQVDRLVETVPENWDDYCIKPMTAAPSPNAALGDYLADSIRQQIPYELACQGRDEGDDGGGDGGWQPHWTWYGNFPETWEDIRPGIAGMITFQMLMALKAWS